MKPEIKILIVSSPETAIYTNHVEKALVARQLTVENISVSDLKYKYNREANPPSFFIVKSEKAAYMLAGKQETNKIIKWIEDSKLI